MIRYDFVHPPALSAYGPNRPTMYQVVLVTVQGETFHLGYTARRTSGGLVTQMRRIPQAGWSSLGLTEATTLGWGGRGRNPEVLIPGVGTVKFSGETLFSKLYGGAL